MAIYAVTNWTERRSHGPFLNESAAFEALGGLLAPGDEYDVWKMPDGSVEVQVIDAGRWPVANSAWSGPAGQAAATATQVGIGVVDRQHSAAP